MIDLDSAGRTGTVRPCGRCSSLFKTLVVSALAFAVHPLAAEPTPLQSLLPKDLDASVPAPESILGYAVGSRAARYQDVERYMKALDDASPLVTMTEYAQSHEGRTLYYVTITSPANHSELGQIRAANAKLADPRKLTNPADADRIIDGNPAVAWMAYSIHGDELSGTDASMVVAYLLAAGNDEPTRKLRDDVVVHIDPSQNPDGRERYLSQLEPLTGKVLSTDYQALQHAGLWSSGRGNHYLFDLNRDWLPQVHPETRGRTAAIRQWNPHLVIDAHEMGSLDTFLFDPPREPFNINLSESNMKWRRRVSADQAKAFDRHGWSYYTQEWYEEWYPGYTNAWANLLGAIGILYEQASLNGAAVRQATGHVQTYEQAVARQFTSSLANLQTLQANRREILRDYFEDRRWAVTEQPGKPEYFVLPATRDRARMARLTDLLDRHGIEHETISGPTTVRQAGSIWGDIHEKVELAAGSLLVRAAQPHRRLLQSILQFDPHMSDKFLVEERRSLETGQGTRVYDVTAWNLGMAYGLEGYWAESVSAETASATPQADRPQADPFASKPAYGFMIDGQSSDMYPAILRLMERDCHIRVARKPLKAGDHEYAAGALLLRNNENPADLGRLLQESTAGLSVNIRPLESALCQLGPDLGGQEYDLLQTPRIAVASQWPVSTTSFGAVWHLLDERLRLRCSPINLQSIGRIDLRMYNVIVLPESFGALGAILNDGVRGQLKSWIEAGGTLVALGGSAAFVAGKDNGLSAVRLKPDVLDKLSVYEEAVSRERASRAVKVDPAVVWGRGGASRPSMGATEPAGDDSKKPEEVQSGDIKPESKPPEADAQAKKPDSKDGDLEALKRNDAWQRTFSPNGVFLQAQLNPEHWLCFGLGDRLPVLFGGSNVFMSAPPVATPVRFVSAGELRLAGLFWPEGKDRVADSAFATVERIGRGQIILFADDPVFRGYTEGTARLLLNALILGPGLGASAAVPW